MVILYSLLALGGIGITAGVILVIAYNRLKVEEDPRIEELSEALPGINCGACGYASCHEYAVSLNSRKAAADLCRAGGVETNRKIASIMGIDHCDDAVPKKAIVRCRAEKKIYLAEYNGPCTCVSAQLLGGGMACKYGCFGYGDCAAVCPFDAISPDKNSMPVVDIEKCTGCGICVDACPRNIIILQDLVGDRIIYVGCSNMQAGKDTREVCAFGCIACRICEKKAPAGSFSVDNNLAGVTRQIPEISVKDIKCPTGCIYEARRKTQD
ncbi:MAG: (Fe-S)-binding protein [Elusimicrobiota bacterium]